MLKRISIEEWKPAPLSSTVCKRDGDMLLTSSDDGPLRAGGWHVAYEGIRGGAAYEIKVRARHSGLERTRDFIQCSGAWHVVGPNQTPHNAMRPYFFLIPRAVSKDEIEFSRTVVAPPEAKELTVRYAFKWAKSAKAEWSLPEIRETAQPVQRVVRAAAVTGSKERLASHRFDSVADHLSFYLDLCVKACREEKAELIVLPEFALQWRLPNHGVFDHAVQMPGPETEAFAKVARDFRAHIVLGTFERTKEGVFHNAAVVIGPEGIVGTYRKVHLATGEAETGILPGDRFMAFQTPFGKIGCNICMDSSSLESSRLAALAGAEILALPIMGDFRADRLTPGKPVFDEERWKAIMRTRAMDNSMCFVVARNTVEGSCVIDQLGTVLAWNDGSRDCVCADMRLDEETRMWSGCPCRDALWLARRPQLYAPFADDANYGQLSQAH